MTPCEKLGYKVGDRFEANGSDVFYDGTIITLVKDDYSDIPLFEVVDSRPDRKGRKGYCSLGNVTKISHTKTQLRPGGYVSTKGMTGKFLGWGEYGELDHQDHHELFPGSHLTIEQVLGESPKEEGGWIKNTSGEQPVEDGTMVVLKMRDGSLWRDGIPRPAEVIGWWFSGDSSDVVEYKVVKEDETQKVQDVRLEDGPPIKRPSTLDFMNSTAQFIELEGEETGTIQSLLKKADKHARKAQKHEAKRQEAIDQARAFLPDGWELTETGVKEVDLNDPANWREGDVLECIDWGIDMTKGRIYEIEAGPISGRLSFRDDAGDYRSIYSKKVRFHHRP